MKRLFILLIACAATFATAQDFGQRGPFRVSESEVTIARTNGTTFGALLFVPAATSARDRTAAPYPAISFGHGFLAPPALYAGTMRHLASWGYVVIATKSGGELFPDHQDYANDIRLCLYWLEAQNAVPGGFLQGLIAPKWGVSGHSMGGGAGLLAAADDPQIEAVATMAPAETRPSAVAAVSRVTAPVCLIAGSDDTFTPPPRHARRMYDVANAPRVYPLILGGYHCGFVDVPLPDTLCDSGAMKREDQLVRARRLLTAFFELYLKNDAAAWSHIWGPAADFDREIAIDRDPGFLLDPLLQRQAIKAGQTATFPLRLTHLGDTPQAYRFEASGNTTGLIVTPAVTGPIAPGGITNVTVSVSLPPGRAPRTYTILSAYPDGDPRTRDYGILGLERR